MGIRTSQPIAKTLGVTSSRAYLRLSTHSARIFASSSVTGLAGIGICPQAPTVPFLMRPASNSAAPSVPAYLAATSFSAGPTIFTSTLWQAAQGLLLNSASASASAAKAGCTLSAAPRTSIGTRIFFMMIISSRLLRAGHRPCQFSLQLLLCVFLWALSEPLAANTDLYVWTSDTRTGFVYEYRQ